MKKFLSIILSLMLCFGLCNHVYASDNFVVNGDFSQGHINWDVNKKENTEGSIEVKNNELKFTPQKSNGNYWELGFKQSNIKLENGKKYHLSFDAKATEDVGIKVTVENQENYAKRLEDTELSLSTKYQKYDYDFTMNDEGLSQLVFHIGQQENLNKDYFFKNVAITEVPVQKIGSWILNEANGVSATLSGTEDEISAHINKTNTNWWDLTLKKDNIDLKSKTMYQINFDIYSSKEGTLSFDIENTNDYTIKAINRTLLNLKEGNNSFEFRFAKRNDAKESVAFHLSSGEGNTDFVNEDITINNLCFKELETLNNEYVFNGTFDHGTIGWEIYNSNGSDLNITTENQQGVLTFSNSQGENWWDAQFFQKDIFLTNGVYNISFDIKADKNSKIHFSVQDTDDYNLKYLEDKELSLSQEYQKMEFTFSIQSDNLLGITKNAKIQFDVGKSGDEIIQKIYIDNIIITKTGDSTIDEKQDGEVNFDVNDIVTNDFKGLGVQWDPYQVHPLTEDEWNLVCERVDYLNPSFIRCMIYATTYCEGIDKNGNPIYNFENDDMKALIKELDYLESRNIEVILGEWEAPDRFKGDFTGVTVDSPLWAKMISGLMDYLINEKEYTCIKYFNYVNEANTEWSYCQDYDKWSAGIHYLYDEFEKIDILDQVKIVGPDTVWDENYTWLKNLEDDTLLNQKIGLYDVHMYPTIDEITNGDIEKTVKAQRSVVTGKDFYMTEIGMVTGKTDGDSQPYVKEFSYGVIMADAVAQVMRGGFSGVAIWDMDDAMHDQDNGFPSTDIRSLKQWGFWNSIAGRVYNQPEEENIRPHFYTWSLMTHLFPRHCSIINASWSDNLDGLRAVGMKTEDGQMTYMIVNNSNIAKEITLKDNSEQQQKIYEYRYFEDDRKVDDLGYPVVKEIHNNINFSKGININLPSGGIVFLTTIDTDTQVQQAQIQIEHIDEITNEYILGSEFELLDETGKVISQWKTQKEPHIINGLNPMKTYVIHQLSAAKGYVKVKDLKISAEDYMKGESLIIKNKQSMGKIILNVVDKDSQKPLSNIEYTISDVNGNRLEILKTNNEGQAISQNYNIFNYENGSAKEKIKYILKESQNNAFYQTDSREYIIEFDYMNDQTDLVEKTIYIQKTPLPIIDTQENQNNSYNNDKKDTYDKDVEVINEKNISSIQTGDSVKTYDTSSIFTMFLISMIFGIISIWLFIKKVK